MRHLHLPLLLLVATACAAVAGTTTAPSAATPTVASGAPAARPAPWPPGTDLTLPGERHLRHVRQLTFGGENAEAYWSFDGTRLILQSTRDGRECDQEYVMSPDAPGARMVSTGTGRVTCGYFLPGDQRIIYASTHDTGAACPPKADRSQGYIWPLYDYQLYLAAADGSGPVPFLPAPGSYTAEATVSKDGWIVFTSTRDGDLDLYKVRVDGSGLTRLTSELGYDGGAFFSPDGKRIVYRASRPETPEEVADYRALLARKLVRPTRLEIMVMDADGSNAHRVTNLRAASFAPFFHPDGRRILFASNTGDPAGRNFDIYMVDDDGRGLERITTFEGFDGFPMFSPDGKRLVFASNRNGSVPGETNVFVADWVE